MIDYLIKSDSITFQDINEISKLGYELFETNCKTAKLYGKPINFSNNQVDKYNMDFWHMGSLENKDFKLNNAKPYYNIKPCNNTTYSNKCSNCINHSFTVMVRTKVRDKCVYRIPLIELFRKIIDMVNSNEDGLKIWKIYNFSNRRTKETYFKIRYQADKIDYLIILNEKENEYFFITAYPVFEQREKDDLKKEYNSKRSIKIK